MTHGWQDALRKGVSDRYRILQELGGGGMSATFIAEEVALQRNIVLKALPAAMANYVNQERFEREIHVAARLQHAFIVPLLAAGVTDGHPWYTMPLVQGDSLRARLSREGAMPSVAVARILRDIAEALAYAHAAGVVHRDIKPDNILLAGAHAHVTDFGVAKALAVSSADRSAVTDIGVALGTPAYMAPEQAAGEASVDHRTDLYALGATGYEMLSGRPMFDHRTSAQLLIAHATEAPESLGKLVPGAPFELVSLIEQLIAKHPNDRPSRAQDVADALGAMLTRWTSGELPPLAAHITLGRALALWGAAFVSVAATAWLAVRWLPVPDWTLPAAILLMLAGLPVTVLSAWLHRPPRPIAATPTASSTTTVGRLEAIVRPHLNLRRARLGGLAAVGLLVLLVSGWAVSRATGIGPAATLRSRGIVAENDRVLVADFESPANDGLLGFTVSELLRTEIGRSESIQLIDAQRRGRLLVAMGRSPDERVTGAVAGEMAQRDGAKVYLAGNVIALGSGYLITSTLLEAQTGREVGRFRESAAGPDDVIDAVDRMGREIRQQLGASLREIRGSEPLSLAVTPSLIAARLYTEGTRLASDQYAALRVLDRAVKEDSTFSQAYGMMASFYENIGNTERAAWAAEQAFRYRDKLPRSAKLLAEANYYRNATAWDPDKSVEAYLEYLDLMRATDNGRANGNSIALTLTAKRDYARALQYWQEAIKTDSLSAFSPYNIVGAYWALGKKDEARKYVYERLSKWQPNAERTIRTRAFLASADFQVDSSLALIQPAVAAMRDSATQLGTTFLVMQANGYLAQGRVARSIQTRDRAYRNDTRSGFPLADVQRARATAWTLGQSASATSMLDSAIAVHPPGNASALGWRWLGVAQAYAMAGQPVKAKQYLSNYERLATPSIKSFELQDLELARGWIAMAEKRYDDAIASFREADVRACNVCSLAPLAHAYDLSGRADSAIAAFERYLSTNYLLRHNPDADYLAGTYKRLGELYDAKGDRERALTYYDRFVDLWKNADPELQPRVQEVRRRIQALRRRAGD